MNATFDLVIVIPTYNEAKRLEAEKFISFVSKYNNILLCFVNDGSNDQTQDVLNFIQYANKRNVVVLNHHQNKGKAAAVYTGITYCNTNLFYNKIAYLDADLATSLEECLQVSKTINGINSFFAFGSRIARLNANIQRKQHRFLIGRFIATIIANQLNLKVYDTQCGCKVFSRSLAEIVFKEEFTSTWLFDVEIFHRIKILLGKERMIITSKEIPLESWVDKDESKVSYTYFFKMWLELLKIHKTYKSKISIPQNNLSTIENISA